MRQIHIFVFAIASVAGVRPACGHDAACMASQEPYVVAPAVGDGPVVVRVDNCCNIVDGAGGAGGSPESLLARAAARLAIGGWRLALADIEEAVRAGATGLPPLLLRARALTGCGRPAEAIAVLDAAVAPAEVDACTMARAAAQRAAEQQVRVCMRSRDCSRRMPRHDGAQAGKYDFATISFDPDVRVASQTNEMRYEVTCAPALAGVTRAQSPIESYGFIGCVKVKSLPGGSRGLFVTHKAGNGVGTGEGGINACGEQVKRGDLLFAEPAFVMRADDPASTAPPLLAVVAGARGLARGPRAAL